MTKENCSLQEAALLARKFIRPMEALTPSYLEAKESAGSVGRFFWCSQCETHSIANNICTQCGTDNRARYGDFLFDPDMSLDDISHHQRGCTKFNLPLYVYSEVTSFDVPESVDTASAASILNYLRQTASIITELAAPSSAEIVCEWKYDDIDNFWQPSCGDETLAFCFSDEGPLANKMTYCFNCRGRIKEVRTHDDTE